MVKRIYIPMPGPEGRRALLRHTLEDQPTRLSAADLERLVEVSSCAQCLPNELHPACLAGVPGLDLRPGLKLPCMTGSC